VTGCRERREGYLQQKKIMGGRAPVATCLAHMYVGKVCIMLGINERPAYGLGDLGVTMPNVAMKKKQSGDGYLQLEARRTRQQRRYHQGGELAHRNPPRAKVPLLQSIGW
jgi:hypothetical protein